MGSGLAVYSDVKIVPTVWLFMCLAKTTPKTTPTHAHPGHSLPCLTPGPGSLHLRTLSTPLHTMEKKNPRTVAVVGSGMAGLVTAYLLHLDPSRRYRVQLLEMVFASS